MSLTPPLPAAYHRLAVGGRILAVLILGIPAVVLGDRRTLLALTSLVIIWLGACVAERVPGIGRSAYVAEAALIATIAAVSLTNSLALLAAMALPPFTAGLRSGVRGLAVALGVQLSAFVAVALAINGTMRPDQASNAITSLLTGLGLGLIASYVHAELKRPPDPLTPYRDAQRLLRDLIDLSGTLGSGLDASALGSRIAVALRDELPLLAVGVYLPRQDELTPLVSAAIATSVDDGVMEDVALVAHARLTPEVGQQSFAIPLVTEGGVVAIVAGVLPPRLDPRRLLATGRLESLGESLAATAVHLDTALLFSKLREAATADERRRLAREMHDGVAQDIASLGYLVDGLAAAPSSPHQAELLQRLRDRITAVVTEVRRSVQTLRTDVDASESLGAAISGLARHLSESSGIRIEVTVSEATTRLRAEVESELLRIVQEAMTNAVRHSGADAIDVDCRVSAPAAEITVRDNGHGLGRARPDSFGLEIMRERARLVDADLAIESVEPSGTLVRVRVPSRHAAPSPGRGVADERVSV